MLNGSYSKCLRTPVRAKKLFSINSLINIENTWVSGFSNFKEFFRNLGKHENEFRVFKWIKNFIFTFFFLRYESE